MPVLKRRWFVRSMIVCLAGVAVTVYQVPQRLRRTIARWQDDLIGPCLPELFQAMDVERIGAHYLDMFPEDRDRAILFQQVFSGSTDARIIDGSATEGRNSACELQLANLSRAIDRDFRAGDLLLIAEWQLTRTEARLCALASLSSN